MIVAHEDSCPALCRCGDRCGYPREDLKHRCTCDGADRLRELVEAALDVTMTNPYSIRTGKRLDAALKPFKPFLPGQKEEK